MIYNGTTKAELIYFHSENDKSDIHFIAMEIDRDEPVFYVRTCCNPDWEWKFCYNQSTYEMVRHAIWDVCFDSNDIEEALFELDGYFEEIFDEIVIWDECKRDCDCETGCEHCGCKE